jgi:hypothetical protein
MVLLSGIPGFCLDLDTTITFSSMDSLFIQATSGEPRFEKQRIEARKKLVDMDSITVGYLITKLGTKDAREKHGIKDLFKEIGKTHGRDYLTKRLCQALDDTSGLIRRRAIFDIGEAGILTAFAESTLTSFKPKSWQERGLLCRVAGKLGCRKLLPYINKTLKDKHGLVRKSAVVALGDLKDTKSIPVLLERLERDSLYIVRFEAARALTGFQEKMLKFLEKAAGKSKQKFLIVWMLCQMADDNQALELLEVISAMLPENQQGITESCSDSR